MTNIRRLRAREGWSACDLVDVINEDQLLPEPTMSQSWLSRLENGHTQPRIDTAFAIAQALGVSIEEAFGLRRRRVSIAPIVDRRVA